MANGVPRLEAVRVITRVLSEGQALDEALADFSRSVRPEEFAWLQEVCSGTLRWRGILDEILNSIALKKRPSGWLRKILLVASYQIVVQDRAPIPKVVNETVSLVREKEGDAPAKFANACLRKISDHRGEWILDSGANLKLSLPEWLWKRLVKEKGKSWALKYAQSSLERPVLWLRSRHEDWKGSNEGIVQGPFSGAWQVTQGGRVTAIPGFLEGKYFVQDISSQLLISEVTQAVEGDRHSKGSLRILDLCASPGGKSVGLAWNGFRVTSTDKNAKRLPLLRETVARTAPEIELLNWESLKFDRAEGNLALQGGVGPLRTEGRGANPVPTFALPSLEAGVDLIWPYDLIWIDAPCSGTGILRRHPEIRWLRKEKELDSLQKAQTELLQISWSRMPSGSYLVYSVCSVLEEEGPGAIARAGILDGAMELKRWALSPQDAPFGDGFWGVLIRKK